MLIQRQWIEFGHKFGDRGGILNSDENEKSPVFLQFLDCVYQLWEKNSDRFEFNRRYLVCWKTFLSCLFIFYCIFRWNWCSTRFQDFLVHSFSIRYEKQSNMAVTLIWSQISNFVTKYGIILANTTWSRFISFVIIYLFFAHTSCSQFRFHNPAYNKKITGGILRFPKILPELLLWRDAYCCTEEQLIINNPVVIILISIL